MIRSDRRTPLGVLAILSVSVLAAWMPRALVASLECIDTPCESPQGSYYLRAPSGGVNLPARAIVFLHGHNSSGRSAIDSRTIHEAFSENGYWLIAPNGATIPGRTTRAWPARALASWRDDVAFIDEIVRALGQQIGLERRRVLIAGFSSGASMAWRIACQRGALYGGFVAISGALRRPVPTDGHCPGGPFRLLHWHGFSDRVVPLEGRRIRDWHQGDVFESLALARASAGCTSQPERFTVDSTQWCREWSDCTAPVELRLCLHPGGHGLPTQWATSARAWFERVSLAQNPLRGR